MDGAEVRRGIGIAAWLISRSAARAQERMDAGFGAHNLTVRSCGVLLVLDDMQVATHQVLRELLDIDKNAMVGLVDDLEQRGWVRRSRSRSDRRRHDLTLTDRGREFVSGELSALVRKLDSTITSPLTGSERSRLCDTLGRAVGNRLGRRRDDDIRNGTGGIS